MRRASARVGGSSLAVKLLRYLQRLAGTGSGLRRRSIDLRKLDPPYMNNPG
jgi:hypothetical protein